jgi:hypothetical protein
MVGNPGDGGGLADSLGQLDPAADLIGSGLWDLGYGIWDYAHHRGAWGEPRQTGA